MSFNFGLAKELYGSPWSIDHNSYNGMMALLRDIRSGVQLELPEEKYNSVYVQGFNSETRIITDIYELDSEEEFNGIGIININGPITLNGGASSFGTSQMSSIMRRMNNDNRIKSFIVMANSGGGSSNAVEVMVDTINEIKQSKDVVAFVPKGGSAYSACYGIVSACTKIYSESEMNGFGSCGTMLQFQAQPKGNVDQNGYKNIVVYASKSTRKNESFNKLIDEGNTKFIQDEMLNPVNEFFLNMIISNRPQLKGTKYDDGHTVFAKNGIGTFIDGIKSFENVVSEIIQGYEINSVNFTQNTSKLESTQNQKKIVYLNSENSQLKQFKMTKIELKANHPELYNEIYNEGINAEKMRVGVWASHFKTDPDAVIEGINGGEELNPVQREQFLIKAHSFERIDNIKKDSPKNVVPASPTTKSEDAKADAESSELESFYGDIDSKFKKN